MESTLFGVGSLTAGYQVEGDGFVLAPYGRAESAWTRLGSASETGAGLLNVSFGEQTLQMLSGVAGLRPDYAVPMGRCYPATTAGIQLRFHRGQQGQHWLRRYRRPAALRSDAGHAQPGYAVAEPGDPAHFDNGLLLGFDYDLLMGLDGDTQQHRVGVHIGADF